MKNRIIKTHTIIALTLAATLFFANCTDDLDYIDRPTKEDLEAASSSSGNAASSSSFSTSSSSFKQEECTAVYNHDTRFCYDGIVYEKCDGIEYNPTTHYCENSIAEEAKCGGNGYNPLTQFCAGNKIYEKCGGKVYDPVFEPKTTDGRHEAEFCDTRDSRIYKAILLGNKIFMAENLKYETKGGSRCYKEGEYSCDNPGRYYNWDTAQEVCPQGWRLPTNTGDLSLLNDFKNLLSVNPAGYYNGGSEQEQSGTTPDDRGVSYWWSSECEGTLCYSIKLKPYGAAEAPQYSKSSFLNVRCIKNYNPENP